MVAFNFSANTDTWAVLLVRMIGVLPVLTALQISSTMRLLRISSSDRYLYKVAIDSLSSKIELYDVNLGIRNLSKDCLAI